jgi:hypothetical protein
MIFELQLIEKDNYKNQNELNNVIEFLRKQLSN